MTAYNLIGFVVKSGKIILEFLQNPEKGIKLMSRLCTERVY